MLELIGRGEPQAAAREFVEIVLGPGAWEMMPEGERATMVANADTFAGEALDPAWANIDLDALSGISVPVLLTQGDLSPPMFAKIIARLAPPMDSARMSRSSWNFVTAVRGELSHAGVSAFSLVWV